MKLKKLLSEIGVEQMKVYSNPYATAFKPIQEDETQDSAEVMVGNYQTKYFDICPGATAVYKDIESKGVDMNMAERAAKLQDALFFIEKHVLNDDETGSAEGYITVAENLADQIMAMAGMMGLEEEHSYIQGHVDKITKAVSGEESVNESQVVNKKTGKDITRHVLDLLSGKIDKKKFEKLTGLKKESVNEAYIVTYAKKKGEKPASAAFQLRGSALSFEKDLKKDGYITMVTQKKVKGIDESINESIASLIDQIRQDSKDVKDFVKNIFKDSEFKKMRNDKEFIKYLKSIYEGVGDSVNEADDVYHKSYTHAIEAAEVYARKKGYTIEDDEMFTKVGMNSKRPSVGKTTRVSLELLKNGKPQKKMLHIQVYGMKNGYELNAYIN
jgi:hypothetical protein